MTNWKTKIKLAAGDDVIIFCTLSEDELSKNFDDGYGGIDGKAFTAWSNDFVYFPVCYDGQEWVSRVPRNPCEIITEHVGGW